MRLRTYKQFESQKKLTGFIEWGNEIDDNDDSQFRRWGNSRGYPNDIYCYEPGEGFKGIFFTWFDDNVPGYYEDNISAISGSNYENMPMKTSKGKRYLGKTFKEVKDSIDTTIAAKKFNL